MIDNEKQREFLMALAGALADNKTNKNDKNEAFAKQSFELFTTLVKAGFTDEQAISLIGAIITAVARQ